MTECDTYTVFVCLEKTNNLRQILTNECTAALVLVGKLFRGKCLLVMLSWASYLRSIIFTLGLKEVRILCMFRTG